MLPDHTLDHFDRGDLRRWMMEHTASARECWVPFYRKSPENQKHVLYLEAVEEALCFGWIDSVLRRMEDGVTRQRFSPRRSGSVSSWSELNKARCMRLKRLGLMTEAGVGHGYVPVHFTSMRISWKFCEQTRNCGKTFVRFRSCIAVCALTPFRLNGGSRNSSGKDSTNSYNVLGREKCTEHGTMVEN